MNKASVFFEKQWLHFFLLAVLILLAFVLVSFSEVQNSFLSLSTLDWFWITLFTAITHQIYIWIAWRGEVHFGLMSKFFGEKAFQIHCIIFSILILSRPVSIIILSYMDRGSFDLPVFLIAVLATIIFIPGLYTGYSIHKYFGFKRAFGGDHFLEEYRNMPFVKEGIFRYSSNSMYMFGLPVLAAIGLVFSSKAGVVAGLFHWAYVWVHYICTEKPDFKYIYKDKQ